MFKNYFKIAIRNLTKNKLHTGINLIGLSVGLGVSILILFFVQFELSFDNFHNESDLIYRVQRHEVLEGELFASFSTPVVSAPTLADEFPQITHVTRMIGGSTQAYLDEATTQNQTYMMVSPDFLKIFDFELIQGDKDRVLTDKFSAVVTEEVVRKYFAETNPIGKSIRMLMGENFEEYQVVGVLKDLPSNSSIQFEMLLNDQNMDFSIGENGQTSWYNVFGETYVKLNDPSAKFDIEAGIDPMMKKVLGENYVKGEYFFSLYPISDMHLSDGPNNGMIESTRPDVLWILAGIAFLILLIACINFTTMAIGRATTRAKEVGVRKTMGAEFGQLVFQFLTEAFLITVSAAIVGLVLAEVLLPTFNDIFEKELELVYGPVQIGILISLILGITALAGAYPAFFMSSLRPIKVLKGNLSVRFGKQALRKGLVAFQFFISFLLIASTLIMVNQMKAIREYDLGFDQNMIVVVDVPKVPSTSLVKSISEGFQQAEKFRQALTGRTEVESAALTVAVYGDDAFLSAGFPLEDGKQFNFRVNFVGGDYIKTMGLEMVEGRDFLNDPGADSSAILINEKFAQAMKWTDATSQMMPGTRFRPHQIVGVVKDFHHASLYQEIEPVMLAKSPMTVFSGITNIYINSSTNPKVMVKGTGTDFDAFRAMLEEEWGKVFPQEAFSFSFMDEAVESQYRADERLGKMVFMAAGIAIMIAAMGLLALAALSIAGRTKEIGIRKVLGASTLSISWMFNREFLFITLAGVLIAVPLSWYLMQDWMAQFAFREWPSWISFLILALTGIGFTLAIVSAQSFRATRINPVNTLKDE